ncbi:MAG: hypothetical protein IPH65_16215 [Dehalococcoidia bacterium]|uniref:hypothetical protein n=1 Tax=Candidatus Amarobacter glycogenicus TaxID=3140699 RepID=UPI003135E17A|nr:hypothetical protein [Dehalococcoidia bacterium]
MPVTTTGARWNRNDGEGDSGGCDSAAFFRFSEDVVELTPGARQFLLGEGRLTKA